MSIDAKIDALIAALNANTAAITGGTPPVVTESKRGPGRPTKVEAAAAQAASPPALSAVAPQLPVQAAMSAPSAPLLTMQAIAKKVVETAVTKRAQVVALLAKFGAARASDVKPENYTAFDAELDAIASGVVAVNPGSDLA